MSTVKQFEANRKNALKSTGPKTPAGKAKSSSNAIKHGILSKKTLVPGEVETMLMALSSALYAAFQPADAVEELLVDDIVGLSWRIRRVGRLDSGILANHRYQEKYEKALDPVKEYLKDEHKKLVSTPYLKEKFRREVEQEEEAASNLKNWTPTLGRAFVAEEHVFGSLIRYEQHLRRELHRTLHELERLQARRKGADVAPPAAVDVTLNGGLA